MFKGISTLNARQRCLYNRAWMVVDIDLEKFFDRVNHDILIAAYRSASGMQE